ncbi:hypothetical protein MD484_g3032, partial [Candolleomyces efflorescens]
MAPPTKYRSLEAKLQANRDKSQRSYERRKDDINRKRREKYRMAKLSVLRKEAEVERRDMSRGIVRQTDSSASFWTSFWLEEAEKQHQIYQTSIRGDSRKYLIIVCEDYLDRAHKDLEGAESFLAMHQAKAGKYQNILTDLRDKVLNSAGVGKEFKQIDDLVRDVVQVAVWLDDISMVALGEGISRVEFAFRNREFDFQK